MVNYHVEDDANRIWLPVHLKAVGRIDQINQNCAAFIALRWTDSFAPPELRAFLLPIPRVPPSLHPGLSSCTPFDFAIRLQSSRHRQELRRTSRRSTRSRPVASNRFSHKGPRFLQRLATDAFRVPARPTSCSATNSQIIQEPMPA